jgi:hypothetical protein
MWNKTRRVCVFFFGIVTTYLRLAWITLIDRSDNKINISSSPFPPISLTERSSVTSDTRWREITRPNDLPSTSSLPSRCDVVANALTMHGAKLEYNPQAVWPDMLQVLPMFCSQRSGCALWLIEVYFQCQEKKNCFYSYVDGWRTESNRYCRARI